MDKGARKVIAAATHPVLVGMAMQRLRESPISQVVTTNTIPLGPRVDPIRDRLVELCVGPLIGEAIHRIHHDRSISELFKKSAGPKR